MPQCASENGGRKGEWHLLGGTQLTELGGPLRTSMMRFGTAVTRPR